jgi:hypothetical protein
MNRLLLEDGDGVASETLFKIRYNAMHNIETVNNCTSISLLCFLRTEIRLKKKFKKSGFQDIWHAKYLDSSFTFSLPAP